MCFLSCEAAKFPNVWEFGAEPKCQCFYSKLKLIVLTYERVD